MEPQHHLDLDEFKEPHRPIETWVVVTLGIWLLLTGAFRVIPIFFPTSDYMFVYSILSLFYAFPPIILALTIRRKSLKGIALALGILIAIVVVAQNLMNLYQFIAHGGY